MARELVPGEPARWPGVSAGEDAQREEGADGPVGRVDELADLQVDAGAGQDVGAGPPEAAFALEVVEDAAQRLARRPAQVGVVAGRGEVGAGGDARLGHGAELRLADRP